jgi:capsular exopolysaccharide synthesis family protein
MPSLQSSPQHPTEGQPALSPAEHDEAAGIPIEREEIAVVTAPRSRIAEQFRALRNSVSVLNRDKGSHTIVLTSALPGEGKTVATLNLAFALAEMPGTEVLVIDANLHKPAVESYLDLPRRQGLTEVLSGDLPMEQGIRRTAVGRVSVLGPGTLPANPSEVLGTDRMRALLNELKQRFTYVLIDTPDASTVSDASLLGAKTDGIVLVVRLGKTPRHEVEQTYNNLEALGGNILGTCLTGV